MREQAVSLGKVGCSSCGFDYPDSSKFCPECGFATSARVASATEEASVLGSARLFAIGTAKEAGSLAKTTLKHELTHKVAAGAALGAAAASVIPFVGTGLGAVVGGGIILYKRLLK